MKVNKKILGLCEVASKDSYRPHLSCIRFEEGKAIATDGYMLLQIEQPTIESDQLPKVAGFDHVEIGDMSLPADGLKKIVKTIKKHKHLEALNHAWSVKKDEKTVVFASTDLETSNLVEMREPDGEYPAYKKITEGEKANEPVIEFGVDAKRMIKLLQAMVNSGMSSSNAVKIRVSNTLNPILMTSEDTNGKEIFALLMPMRINE